MRKAVNHQSGQRNDFSTTCVRVCESASRMDRNTRLAGTQILRGNLSPDIHDRGWPATSTRASAGGPGIGPSND